MHPDCGYDRVRFGIDHAYVAGCGVDHVNLVLLCVDSETSRFAAHAKRLRQFEGPQINHADGIALSVADIGIFPESRLVIRQRLLTEIPPSRTREDRNEDSSEEELAQGSKSIREKKKLSRIGVARPCRNCAARGGVISNGYLVTAAVSRTPISGTLRATTAAICRTCSISTSN